MGNWRTVHIDGTIDREQVEAARKVCLQDYMSDDCDWHALAYSETPSICGLHSWPDSRINAVGNCAERDFTVEDVAEALRKVAAAAPSFKAKVHCGGDYESTECIATITVADGSVTLGDPECAELPQISQAQMMGRLFAAMQR